MGESVGVLLAEAYHVQQLIHPLPPLLGIGAKLMQLQALRDDLAYGEKGIQRGVGVRKIICIFRVRALAWARVTLLMSWPSNTMVPPSGS